MAKYRKVTTTKRKDGRTDITIEPIKSPLYDSVDKIINANEPIFVNVQHNTNPLIEKGGLLVHRVALPKIDLLNPDLSIIQIETENEVKKLINTHKDRNEKINIIQLSFCFLFANGDDFIQNVKSTRLEIKYHITEPHNS